MDVSVSRFLNKILYPSRNQEQYDLYKAGLEWDLVEPIVIEKREDLKSELQWKDKLDPFHHQVRNLITFCRRLPVTLLADDVGLGKTISAGLIISELISRHRIAKILIVCPKLLLPQWKEELDTKFGIASITVVGGKLKSAVPPNGIGAVITTYHSARLYLKDIAKSGFDMLILDEAHKLRNLYGVDPPPQVALRFREALAGRLFKYVLMLTATPIQNRLWDLYSLVDLLTVARGHQNPFGSQGLFARKFIADNRTQARYLNTHNKDEFRSIVYGYMSRIRRADANLYFPDRKVQLHAVPPTAEELALINAVAEPLKKMNRLAQISILQALISSPEALSVQLQGMAKRGTAPAKMAAEVKAIVDRQAMTAKLKGLEALVERLRNERPEDWRMIVFTGRRETQTTIQLYLENKGIKCGIINGDSGIKNQEAISYLKTNPPGVNVIVSTDAGSEGVNLQAANVLVNYDLPWNPMIVEQRIGRIQRLASHHANVAIFNIVLRGTFEEYIVGRLMEKLQMASHAIGDIEALLEASGVDDSEDSSGSFEEHIRKLVMASLSGKNAEEETRKAMESIENAKEELAREQRNIDTMLGGMGDSADEEPRCPHLPQTEHSMEPRSFVLAALGELGARIIPQVAETVYVAEHDGRREWVCFDDEYANAGITYTLYQPGSPAFARLVSSIITKGQHRVEDVDMSPAEQAIKAAKDWLVTFGGVYDSSRVEKVWRCFEGLAMMRVRATVAHDSYERLIDIRCNPGVHHIVQDGGDLQKLSTTINKANEAGIDSERLVDEAKQDPGIAEFCRFYSERLTREVVAAGGDSRKRKKLEDDFTPRLEIELVGLDGRVCRQFKISVTYTLDSDYRYSSEITVLPSENELIEAPKLGTCEQTGKNVPTDCLAECAISKREVLIECLQKSELSGRAALPEYMVTCGVSGKRVLVDEVDTSSITGKPVTKALLKHSSISGKQGEPEFFTRCEFTSADILKEESAKSDVSGKTYRIDEQLQSAVSGKRGHKQEFVFCAVTNKPLLPNEAERCEVTDKIVMPGILETCDLTGKKVLPTELDKSAVSGRIALKKFFVSSSLSSAHLLEQEAIKSVSGNYCAPIEAKPCLWSGRKCHIDDLRVCDVTGLPFHLEYMTKKEGQTRLEPLNNILEGIARKSDKEDRWADIASSAKAAMRTTHGKVERAVLSPDEQHLAICLEVRTLMGLKVRYAGFLYSLADNSIVGRIAIGKREPKGWVAN